MKTLNLHATKTKKSYRKPVLKKIGTVSTLTKGIKGSTRADGASDLQDPL